MPGAGTDKTKNWVAEPGPIVVLVEPQLGENIGSAARAMANFGLSRMRLVKPRQGWPNEKAHVMAAGADRVLEGAVLYDTAAAAVADCTMVFAATARAHDQAKPVVGPRGGGAADGARASARGRTSPSCSGASATASKATRSGSPTASSHFRSIRPSPRSTCRRPCW